MDKEQLVLTHIEFIEHVGDKLNWRIRKSPFASFNLILGDNAQGKTRLINLLRFLQLEHTVMSNVILPNLKTEIELTFSLNQETIVYHLRRTIPADGTAPEFEEEITRGDRLLFSRNQKLLIEEVSGKKVDNFFIPSNLPAISSIAGDEFPTFKALKSFFERMLFLEANRFTGNNIEASKGAFLLNPIGSNVGSVLDTWRQNFPEAFNEVVAEFQAVFNFVDGVTTRDDLLTEQRISVPFMFYLDKESKVEIRQNFWSDGMLRSMALYVLVATRFPTKEGKLLRPSLVCVDEIENGLDFQSLSKVLAFYEDHSDLMQIILTSHSPIACNMVEPKDWHIAKRKGVEVEFFSLREKELDLNAERKKLLDDNWQFYKNHVAKSKLYIVK